jgi:hypothetical protein
MSEVKILDFERDERGSKVGTCDFKITYTEEKWEIFRNVAIFVKEDKKWLSFHNIKKGDKWFPIYERNPRLSKGVFSSVLSLLERDFF